MKKFFVLLLSLVLVISMLIGCTNATPTVSKGTESKSEETNDITAEITMWTLPMIANAYDELLKTLVVPALNKKYPNIKVDIELLSWEGVAEKLQISLATGTTPDLYLDGTARTASLPTKGVCVDITVVVDRLKNRYIPSLITIGQIDGKNYLFPASAMSPIALSYNKTLAKNTGAIKYFPEDGTSWTLEDMYNAMKTAHEYNKNYYGCELWAGTTSCDIQIYSLLLGNGGRIMNDDHSKSVVNSPANLEVISLLKRINDEGICPAGAATNMLDAQSAWKNGEVLINLTGGTASQYTKIRDAFKQGTISKDFELDVVLAPHPSNGKIHTATWGANCIALFKNAKNESKIAAAKEFLLAYAACDELHVKTAQAGSYFPAFTDISVTYDDPIVNQWNVKLNSWLPYGDSGFGVLEPYWTEVRNAFSIQMQGLYQGTKTPEKALSGFDSDINGIISKKK